MFTSGACANCCAQVACLRFAFGGVAFARLRARLRQLYVRNVALHCWAKAPVKITRITLTIKLHRNWNSFQLANSAPPLSVTDSAIAPSARKLCHISFRQGRCCRGRARVSMTCCVLLRACACVLLVAAYGFALVDVCCGFLLGPEGPSKIQEVTLMRPIHGNLQ